MSKANWDKPGLPLGPCQMHAVFNDAQDWQEYEAQKAVDRIRLETVKAEMIDEANELKRRADRLLKLAGRL